MGKIQGKPKSVLKKDLRMDVLLALGNFQRYMEQLDLRKANGQLLPEIQVAFFLEHQRTSLDEYIGNCRKMNNCRKVRLIPNN